MSASEYVPRVGLPAPEKPLRAARVIDRGLRALAVVCLAIVLVVVVVYKAAFLRVLFVDPWFGAYGIIVCAYILTRFGLSLAYRPTKFSGQWPAVAIIMPAFNEQDAIAGSISSILATEYPAELLEVVVIDDGSTDGTAAAIASVADGEDRVRVISFPENRGKREAMAAGIRSTSAEIVAFVDSDSELAPDALRMIVQDFADPKVGAVAGHAEVLNVTETWLTRMQAVRYFVAFRVVKAAESVFGAVTCCSGCFSAYRRAAIMPRLELWENQTFLGVQSTFGDDRSLTNHVMRGWKVRYQARAVSSTIVPPTFRKFMRQQLRWKRSWTRESLIVAAFIWRKHPAAALATYVGIVLPLVAPFVAVRAVTWQPLVMGGGAPVVYLVGIYAMALVYGLYYAAHRGSDGLLWIFGVVFCFFYVAFLLWQTYWAILTARSSSWGTRAATAEAKT
jgi:hyaluronan synthase